MRAKSARASSLDRKTSPKSERRSAPRLIWTRDRVARLRQALDEDLGPGDITTAAIVPRSMAGRGQLIAKEAGILCGAPVFARVFKLVDPNIRIRWRRADGQTVAKGDILADLSGRYGALLEAERVALNFIQRLSGVATLTRAMVTAAGGPAGPDVCDTRKTTPLWRALERYAVRVGGGVNHRLGLFDLVLIKENHARAAGGLAEAIRRVRAARPRAPIAAEARNEREVRQALEEGARLILLDNMAPAKVKRIVERHRAAGVAFEVTGGVTLRNIGRYAESGADRISVGALTHSAPALDLSLQLYPGGKEPAPHAHLS